MKTIIIAITLGLALGTTLAACGGDAPPKKEKVEIPDIVKRAAAGDEDAMRILERKLAEKAKAEKKKMDAAAVTGDPLAAFQKALLSGADIEQEINILAEDGNPNARHWNAITNKGNTNLSASDKLKFRETLEGISMSGDRFQYATFASFTYPLSAEAAFNISEDKLHGKWLYDLDTDGAVTYLKQAAEGGHPEAMFKLATRYQYALGVDEDLSAAKAWLEKSAAASNRDAKTALANWKDD